jgi:death-on-curing protein
MNPLSLSEAEYIAHGIAQSLMEYDEPVPPFSTRHPGRLESCLEQPFITYDGVELYPSLPDKAAMLFYLVIKNHPFENGNKRMAVSLMLVFLYINKKWIEASPKGLYDVACDVAKSSPKNKDAIVEIIAQFLRRNLVDA